MPLDPRRLALPFAVALMAPAPAMAASDTSTPEQTLEAYVGGLREGRVELLEELFLSDGQFCTLNEGAATPIDCKRFAEVLGGWAAHPDPQASGRILDRRDATPSMTAVTYELRFGGDVYVDHLLLYRTGTGWRVVAKTTAVR